MLMTRRHRNPKRNPYNQHSNRLKRSIIPGEHRSAIWVSAGLLPFVLRLRRRGLYASLFWGWQGRYSRSGQGFGVRNSLFVVLLLALIAACTPAVDEVTEPATLPTRAVLETSEAILLEPWVAADGEIISADDSGEWQFFGRERDNIRLRVVSADMTPTMSLIVGDETIAEGDTIEISLPQDGLYRVRVTSADGRPGRYQIGLGYTDQPTPNQPPDFFQRISLILRRENTADQTTAPFEDATGAHAGALLGDVRHQLSTSPGAMLRPRATPVEP